MLKELLELEKPPNQVVMIDLDEAVMVGCSKHMRSVSGHYMDKEKRKGENYEVICGDAIAYMEKAKVSFMIDNMKYMAKIRPLFNISPGNVPYFYTDPW